jgi:hypothetical protein
MQRLIYTHTRAPTFWSDRTWWGEDHPAGLLAYLGNRASAADRAWFQSLAPARGKPLRIARQIAVQQGLTGPLARLLNDPLRGEILRVLYALLGWPGVIVQLATWRPSTPAQKRTFTEALLDAVWCWRWRWRIDRCAYPRPHGFDGKSHWYVRHPRGPQPQACPLRMRAARQARWRRELAETGTRTPPGRPAAATPPT